MKTDELIRAVVADNASLKRPLSQTIALALGVGVLVGAAVFSGVLGPRPDFTWALANSPRFDFKLFFTLAVAACAFLLIRRLARPDGSGSVLGTLTIPLGALAIAVVMELMALPADHWLDHARGSNWLICMTMIPILSLAPFIAIFYALRQGAPSDPARTGAAGGILAAAVGAALYATHCTDDSPLFVSIWYIIAMGFVALAGAVLGRLLLRW